MSASKVARSAAALPLRAAAIWADNFTPLRLHTVRVYLSGQAVSTVGNFLQTTALGLLVYQLSGGLAVALGIQAACQALPLLLLSPFAGALADRLPRRQLLLACAAVQAAVAVALALLTHGQWVQLWHVYGLALLLGAVQSVHFPAQHGLLFDLAGVGQIRKLVAINSMVLNISRTGGPALAGFLVARYGAAPAFALNALSFMAVIAALWALRQALPAHRPAATGPGLGEVLRMVAGHVQLRSLYACAFALHALGLAMLQMAPALTGGDARATGLVLGAAGAGSLAYAFVLSPFVVRLPRMGLALSLGMVWMGGWLVVAALSPQLPLRLLAMFMFGLATSMVMVSATGSVQVIAPEAQRGRLLGLQSMVGFGSQPLATLGCGALADRIGAGPAVAVVGALAVALALLLMLQPPWRRWHLQ